MVYLVQCPRISASICHIMVYLVQSPRICASICHIVVYLVQSPRIMPLYVILVCVVIKSYACLLHVMYVSVSVRHGTLGELRH